MLIKISRVPLALLCCLICLGCKILPHHQAEAPKNEDPKALYEKAQALHGKKNYKKALALFEEIEASFPFSKWAMRSQFSTIVINYDLKKYDDVSLHADNYIHLYPNSINISYIYYLRAASSYHKMQEIGAESTLVSTTEGLLHEFINMFPNSEYTLEVKHMLSEVENTFVEKELNIGKFYLNRGKPISAIKRLHQALDKYPNATGEVKSEILFNLVAAYAALDILEEAEKTVQLLKKEHSDSKWEKMATDLLNKARKISSSL